MVTLEYARAYVDQMQRVAARPRVTTPPAGLRRLLSRRAGRHVAPGGR